jgi:MFS family permease
MLLGAPCLAMIGMSSSMGLMIAMTAAYGLFRGLFESNTHASLFDVVPPAFRSSAEGYLTMVGFFFGGLSGIAMGALSEKYGVRGFEIGFAIMGATYAVGALAMALSCFFFFRKNRVVD